MEKVPKKATRKHRNGRALTRIQPTSRTAVCESEGMVPPTGVVGSYPLQQRIY